VIALFALLMQLPAAPPADVTQRLIKTQSAIGSLGPMFSDSVWPQFRADTIPVLYVVPDVGTYLFSWRGPLPEGFGPVPGIVGGGWQPAATRGAASTGTSLAGRPTAQVVVRPGASVADLIGLTAHEAFHVFQGVAARDGRRFGTGENSFLVSSYPVFDAANEAAMALEGRLLGAAIAQRDTARRRELLREFVAVRETRQRRLQGTFATFEQLCELNEGLAEYALVRTLMLYGAPGRQLVDKSTAALDSLTRNVAQSIRLRFYVTGPAQGRLLDQLEGPRWKTRLLAENLTLQDAIALASGARDAERAVAQKAEAAFGMPALRAQADSGVSRLQTIRRAQADSLLALPGVQLTITLDSLPPRRLGFCMIDPQNLLQADEGVLLHTRAVRLCAGAAFDASFTTAVIQDNRGGSVRAVIGAADSVRVTSAGKPVTLTDGQRIETADLQIQTPALTLRAARAELELRGTRLTIRPK
jgi:hypothetical protein